MHFYIFVLDVCFPISVVVREIGLSEQLQKLKSKLTGMKSLREGEMSSVLDEIDSVRDGVERLELAFAGIGDGIWDKDSKTNRVWRSDRCYAMLGYGPDEVEPTTEAWLDLVHPDDNYRIIRANQENYENDDKVYDCEYRVRDAKGNWRWILDRGRVLLRDEQGKPLRMVGTHTDITHRKALEAELLTSRERLHMALEGGTDGLWDMYIQSGEVYRSSRCYEMLGYQPGEIGANAAAWRKLIHPHDLPVLLEARRRHIEGEVDGCDVEYRIMASDGSWHWIFDRGKIVTYDSGGRPLRMVGVHSDITARKQAEQALSDERRFLQTLIDAIPSPIHYRDHKAVLMGCNRAYEQVFQLKKDEIIGKSVYDIFDPEKAKAFYAKDIDPENLDDLTQAYETTIERPGEDPLHLAFYKAKFTAPEGGDGGVIIVAFDITERKHAEEELRRLARTDSMTGACNRGYFIELAERELHRSLRYKHPLSILIIDIDHFKEVNDSYGHARGDEAIMKVSRECMLSLRETDIFARLGGDEFAVLMPETGTPDALSTAQRLCESVRELVRIPAGDKTISVTLSIGVATLVDDSDTIDSMMTRADEGLYAAKRKGRNQASVC